MQTIKICVKFITSKNSMYTLFHKRCWRLVCLW